MPLYEYECKKCQKVLEVRQKFSDAPLSQCPECGCSDIQKLISRTSFQLKGSGWYASDYKKSTASSQSSTKPAENTSCSTNSNTSGCGSGACGKKNQP